jgi:hypothetical protein
MHFARFQFVCFVPLAIPLFVTLEALSLIRVLRARDCRDEIANSEVTSRQIAAVVTRRSEIEWPKDWHDAAKGKQKQCPSMRLLMRAVRGLAGGGFVQTLSVVGFQLGRASVIFSRCIRYSEMRAAAPPAHCGF